MAVSIPRKKKLVKLLIILSALVFGLLNQATPINNSAQETLMWQLTLAKIAMDTFDDNEANWTTDQNGLGDLIDTIYNAHEPEALSVPTEQNYIDWASAVADKLARV